MVAILHSYSYISVINTFHGGIVGLDHPEDIYNKKRPKFASSTAAHNPSFSGLMAIFMTIKILFTSYCMGQWPLEFAKQELSQVTNAPGVRPSDLF